jgi:hypothetical protein
MVNNYALIEAAVVAKLNTIDGVKYVYAYEKGQLEGYPAVSVFSAEYNPAQVTNQHDEDEYIFTVNLYQEMQSENTTPAQAEVIVNALMVKIMQAFQVDYTLGSKCDNLNVRAVKGWTDREIADRACVFTITVKKTAEITP